MKKYTIHTYPLEYLGYHNAECTQPDALTLEHGLSASDSLNRCKAAILRNLAKDLEEGLEPMLDTIRFEIV